MEAKVDKLDINKLVNVLTSLNNLKANFYDSDGDKLKTVLVDLNKSSDVVNNEVVTNTKFKTPKTKANNLDKKIGKSFPGRNWRCW